MRKYVSIKGHGFIVIVFFSVPPNITAIRCTVLQRTGYSSTAQKARPAKNG